MKYRQLFVPKSAGLDRRAYTWVELPAESAAG